jgi:hypothetical protein
MIVCGLVFHFNVQIKPLFETKMTNRKVNGLRKKMVAASQKWRCASCDELLEATFEVDHKVRLCDGGANSSENLQALCQTCHGRKTFNEQMMDIESEKRESITNVVNDIKLIKCLWCHEIITEPKDPRQRYHDEIRAPFNKSCKHLQKLATHEKWKKEQQRVSQFGAFVW